MQPRAIAPELTIIIFLFLSFKSLISFAKLESHFFLTFLFSSTKSDEPIFITTILEFLRDIRD